MSAKERASRAEQLESGEGGGPGGGSDAPGGAKTARARLRSVGRAPDALDGLIHQRMRLAIMSALAVAPSLSFSELKSLLDTSDGNVSVHTRKLEEAGYLEAIKSFRGRTPHTEYRMTAEGRKALERYLSHMEGLIDAARG